MRRVFSSRIYVFDSRRDTISTYFGKRDVTITFADNLPQKSFLFIFLSTYLYHISQCGMNGELLYFPRAGGVEELLCFPV